MSKRATCLDTGEGMHFLTHASHGTTCLFTGGKNILSSLSVIAQGRFTYWVRNEHQDVFELNCFMCFLNILVWDICLCLKTHLFISTMVYIKSLETESHRCCMMWVLKTIHSEKMWHSFLPLLFPNKVKSPKFVNPAFLCTQNPSFWLSHNT